MAAAIRKEAAYADDEDRSMLLGKTPLTLRRINIRVERKGILAVDEVDVIRQAGSEAGIGLMDQDLSTLQGGLDFPYTGLEVVQVPHLRTDRLFPVPLVDVD